MFYSYEQERLRMQQAKRSPYALRQYQPGRAFFHQNPMLRYFHRRNEQFTVARKRVLSAINTQQQARDYTAQAREKVAQVVGPLPAARPGGVQMTARHTLPGYTLECLLIESLPGYWLTANFYCPENLAGKAPAIMFYCGHTPEGKAGEGYMAFCVEAALNGFCVLTFDPVGQGERFFLDGTHGVHLEPFSPDSVHCHLGHQMHLLGEPLNRYMTWDNLAALDYLCTRPEVDAGRVGVTGNSGGGTASAFVGALSGRVAAIAPSCYITQFADLAYNCGVQEIEQVPYGMMKQGLDISDLMNAAAPKPYCVSGGLYDFFPVEGLRDATAESHRLYCLLDAQEDYDVFIGANPHSFARENRRHVLCFFLRHLSDGRDAVLPRDGVTIPEAEQTLVAGGDVRKVDSLSLLDIAVNNCEQNKLPVAGRGVFSCLRGVLGLQDCHEPRGLVRLAAGGGREELRFESEPGQTVYATYEPGEGEVLYLDVGERMGEGPCLIIEPRGTGRAEVAPGSFYFEASDYYMSEENTLAWNAILHGQNLCGLRTCDVICAVKVAHERHSGPVVIRAKGRNALYALFAATQIKVKEVQLHGLLCSYQAIVDGPDYDYAAGDLPYGILRHFDIDDIIAALRGDEIGVTLEGRANAMGEVKT